MPKVFLSYAWENQEHRDWVKSLADKLLADGIHVIVDQYDLALGDRLPQFMEQSVTSADYVLIVCTPTYKQKADARAGGVGYEGHIISDELFSRKNERKFIPILKDGSPSESPPTFLAGKLAVNLSEGLEGDEYNNLVATLYGTRRKPIVKANQTSADSYSPTAPHKATSNDAGPIRIVGIIVDEVGEPRNDGTRGSALYKVPFRLSAKPSATWSEAFIQSWNMPPKFSTMHRPGIASVIGGKIILNGTTVEEVRDYHKETLLLCVEQANKQETLLLRREEEAQRRKMEQREQHRKNVATIVNDITF